MKKLSYILMALVLVLGLAQCKKEQPKPQGEKVYITLKVDDGAKHTVDPENGTVTYADGDVIYVGNGSNFIGYLTRTSGVFGGTIDVTGMVISTSHLYFYFVGGAGPDPTGLTTSTTDFIVNISDQSSQLPVLSYTSAEYIGEAAYNCKLLNQCALVELTLTSGTTAAVGIGDRYTEATINFGGTPGIAPNTSTTGMITMKSESETKKYAIMLPQAATDGAHIAIGPEGYTLDIPAIENNGFAKLSNSSAVASNIVYLNYLTADYTATNGQTLTGTLDVEHYPVKISIADGATITLNGVTINGTNEYSYAWAGLTCLGDATIILKDGTTNTVKGFYENYPGIHVPAGSKLTIQGGSEGTGKLTASPFDGGTDYSYGAGIGGGFQINCGNIKIQGGVITATGGQSAAGIGGGGSSASCGTITISGGNITANGGELGAGIGTGAPGTCLNITISGGSITANGGASGAGIGTGFNGNCGSITIYNTVTSVTATKGSSSPNSIGPGLDGTCGTVTIGGTVYWNGSAYQNDGATYLTTSPLVYPTPAPSAPTGALGGKFTVNAGGGQVSFSQGNLQYQASTSTWRFAPNQYDFVGDATVGNVYENETKCNNANISNSYTGWIDLFGWGTGNNPTNSSINNGDYSTCTDWGVNAISNGGNTSDLWRTLGKDEWVYLFNTRTNAANLRTFATVNGVVGLILMPDGWTADGVSLTITTANYTSNIISLGNWNTLESQGCVFLPSAGYRGGTTLDLVQDHGSYWSNTAYNSDHAYYLDVKTNGLDPRYENNRYTGLSVRLVYETPFQGAGTESDPYLISSEADWIILANKVNSGNSFTGKFFRQTANINVTTMVGNSSDSKPFSGTYDGDGKTLNLSLNTSTPHTAPFRLIANATIKNVVTTGTVHSTDNHPSGLVGTTDGTCTIQNCRVGANVGGAQHSGGIVGHSMHANIYIIGCVYSGTLSPASGQKTGGILGWGGDGGGHTMTISNCLFAGTVVGSTTFHPVGIVQTTNNTRTVSNTYYTVAHNMSDENTHGNSFVNGLSYKGKFARSITAGTGVTVARTGATAVYDVSGITSYGTGILYDGVLYAGDGEAVSLSLSHGAAPSGYTFGQYTVTGGGSLNTPTSDSPTLTMTDANQTINALFVNLLR